MHHQSAAVTFIVIICAALAFTGDAKADGANMALSQEGAFDLNKEGYCSVPEQGKMQITIHHAPQYYSMAEFPKKTGKGEDIVDGKCYCFNGHIVFHEQGELSGIIKDVHNVNPDPSACGAD